jgi:hypothetical protein
MLYHVGVIRCFEPCAIGAKPPRLSFGRESLVKIPDVANVSANLLTHQWDTCVQTPSTGNDTHLAYRQAQL